MESVEPFEEGHFMNYLYEETLAEEDPRKLIDHLDILLANGLLGDQSKEIIERAIVQLDDSFDQVRMALYLIMISPDYAILR